jgi:hypothetical protein
VVKPVLMSVTGRAARLADVLARPGTQRDLDAPVSPRWRCRWPGQHSHVIDRPSSSMVTSGRCDITSCGSERLLRLEQADQAVVLLEGGTLLFDEFFVRDRQLFSLNLANALAQPGKQCDLDVAAGRGVEAIRLAEGLDSTRNADLLRDLSHQLSPHAKVPAVRDFLDRTREFSQA